MPPAAPRSSVGLALGSGRAATLAVLPQLRQCAQLAPAPGGTDNHR